MKYNLAQNEPLEINGDVYIKGVGTYDGTNVGGNDVKTLKDVLDNSGGMTEITWSDLVDLRDNGELIPGMQYRIIDYVTYVSDLIDYAHSVEDNQFDIIVAADSTNKLNENARACLHEGDTYFSGAGSKLESWELKYCLDNDTTRFDFVLAPHNSGIIVPDFTTDVLEKTQDTIETDNGSYYVFGTKEQAQEYYGDGDVYFCCETQNPEVGDYCYIAYYEEGDDIYYIDESMEITNIVEASNNSGKGVIYYMKDEWNNECQYDFKNIQFKRYKVTATSKSNLSDLVGAYIATGTSMSDFTVDENQSVWRYTFNTNSLIDDSIAYDSSINGFTNSIYDNVILDYVNGVKLSLNGIVFNGQYCYGNSFGTNCYHNTFGNYFQYNTFGNECYSNTFGNECYSNTFGNYCYYNTFGNNCWGNTFGNNCGGNTFGNNFQYNTFGNECYSNTFGNYCYRNTFGNNNYSNTFGNNFQINTFGNNCNNNTFGNNCNSNTFGNNCRRNTFGNNFQNNTFGNNCYRNTFGNNIEESQFGDGVQYFSIIKSEKTTAPTASDIKSYVKWLIVENGVRYVNAYVTSTTSSSSYCQNVRICQGCSGTSASRKSFSIENINSTSQLLICYDTSGNLRSGNLGNLLATIS